MNAHLLAVVASHTDPLFGIFKLFNHYIQAALKQWSYFFNRWHRDFLFFL
jgi:hypothetical protein